MKAFLRGWLDLGLSLVLWCLICSCDICVQWDLSVISIGGWYVVSKTGCTVGLLIWALQFFFGRRIRWVYAALVVWMSLVLVLEWFVYLNFNMTVAGDLWLFISGSSKDEALSFVSQFVTFGTVILALLGFACAAAGVCWVLRARYPKVGWRSVAFGAAALAAACSLAQLPFYRLSSYDALTMNLISRAIVSDSIANREKWRNLRRVIDSPQLPSGTRSAIVAGKEPLGVVVIGESATRNHMHLYGYGRGTTPWADSCGSNLVVFTDYLGSASHTQLALKDVFTDCTLDGDGLASYTLPQILANAGYEMSLVSAQGHWGRGSHDSYMAMVFNSVQSKFYLEEVTNVWPRFDSMLISPIAASLGKFQLDKPSALFVHLGGSHYHFKDRTPPGDMRWQKDCREGLPEDLSEHQVKNINLYDNSIRFTDAILSNVVSLVEKQDRPSFVLYFSDHGESPASTAMRDQSDNDMWELPLFIWFSDSYRSAYPDIEERARRFAGRPLQGDQLTTGLAELFGVRTGDETANFLSEKFKVRQQRYIMRGKKRYDPAKRH